MDVQVTDLLDTWLPNSTQLCSIDPIVHVQIHPSQLELALKIDIFFTDPFLALTLLMHS